MSWRYGTHVPISSNDEEELEISMTVTIYKAKGRREENVKGKGSIWLVEINWTVYHMEILTVSKSSHKGDLDN